VRLLIDTHAMVWYVDGDPRVSRKAATLIQRRLVGLTGRRSARRPERHAKLSDAED
jgi:hypothetical protein